MTFKLTEAQEQWLTALESGKYKKGFNNLNKDNKYCCLGVACEVFQEELGLKKSQDFGKYNYNNHTSIAPKEIIDHLGLHDDCGGLSWAANHETEGTISSLVQLNDMTDLNFKEIAQFIRENSDKVFRDVV